MEIKISFPRLQDSPHCHQNLAEVTAHELATAGDWQHLCSFDRRVFLLYTVEYWLVKIHQTLQGLSPLQK